MLSHQFSVNIDSVVKLKVIESEIINDVVDDL